MWKACHTQHGMDNYVYLIRVCLGEPCPPGSAQGRLLVEVSLQEFSVLLLHSQNYRQGIDCRERVKVLGGFWESCWGRRKPGLSHSHILAFGRSGWPAERDLPCWVIYTAHGQTIEYDCKLEIHVLACCISEMAFRLFGVHVGPVARDKVEESFCLLIVSCKFRTYFLFLWFGVLVALKILTEKMLLSFNDCGKFVQTTMAVPSNIKIHYYLPDNGKCIDSGCSMAADICRWDGGVFSRFLNFGTSCGWAVSFPCWVLYT